MTASTKATTTTATTKKGTTTATAAKPTTTTTAKATMTGTTKQQNRQNPNYYKSYTTTAAADNPKEHPF